MKKISSGYSGSWKNCSGRVGLAEKASGRVNSRVGFWPDPSLGHSIHQGGGFNYKEEIFF